MIAMFNRNRSQNGDPQRELFYRKSTIGTTTEAIEAINKTIVSKNE